MDPDGDIVKCRWATSFECGHVCTGLPTATLYSNCTITLNATSENMYHEDGIYTVALMVEDFPRQTAVDNVTEPLSSVPLQVEAIVTMSKY